MGTIENIENAIGYVFKNKQLLQTALTHTSYANEHNTESFERMEFLGDSILGFVTAQALFRTFPDKQEGELSKIRAGIVCEDSIANFFRELNLSQYLRLGVGEERTGGRNKNSILSDSFEALIAAIYLDSGIESVSRWIQKIITPDHYLNFNYTDWKTILQEKYKNADILYSAEEFKDQFSATVYVDGRKAGTGIGATKKAAEQSAAKQALNK